MKYIWFIDKDEDIWKVSEDYSYTIYYKNINYTTWDTWNSINESFNNCKRIYKLKEISESDAILEML